MSFSSGMELRSYQLESSRHSHEHAQLVLALKGTLELEIGHCSGIVNHETAAFIPAGEDHCFAGSRDNRFIVVDINTHHPILSKSFYSLNSSTKKLISFTQDYLDQELKDYGTQSLIYNLLITVLGQSNELIIDTQVRKAKNWLDLNFAQAIDLSYLAKHCYLSTSQLQRRFKKVIGCTLAHYWRNKKMEQAKVLLATSAHSIETIAFSLGYEHLSTFTRFFTQQYGHAPSQWRAMQNLSMGHFNP